MQSLNCSISSTKLGVKDDLSLELGHNSKLEATKLKFKEFIFIVILKKIF